MTTTHGVPILTRDQCLSIRDDALPLVVLTDKLWGMIPGMISGHTKNRYSHSMILWLPGEVVTQGFDKFKTDALANWLSGNYRVKFWAGTWTDSEKARMIAQMRAELAAPWYRKLYDYPGILGQWLRATWIQAPHAGYCSERVAGTLRAVDRSIPKRPRPGDLDRLFERRADWHVYGIFDPEIER